MSSRLLRAYRRAWCTRQNKLLTVAVCTLVVICTLSGGDDTLNDTLHHKTRHGSPQSLQSPQSPRTYRPDEDSDTWAGPLPVGGWHKMPRKYLTSHRLYHTFKRSDLRLSFKVLPSVMTNDDALLKEFPCTQSQKAMKLDPNVTEDIMCVPRPKLLPEFLNPCFNYTAYGNKVQCIPYFHVLGVDKSGTTDFHSRLMGHPQVLPIAGGMGKETYYWAWKRYGIFQKKKLPAKDRFAHYIGNLLQASVQIINNLTISGVQFVTGDGSPMDFWDFRGWIFDPHNEGLTEAKFLTPHAMRHIYKDPKFFVLMRDPADRSDYM